MTACVDRSVLPLLCRLYVVKPSPKAKAGKRADCSRDPVTCGAALALSGVARAGPARPSDSAVTAAVTAIALNFMVSSPARSPARPSGALTAWRDDHSGGQTRR